MRNECKEPKRGGVRNPWEGVRNLREGLRNPKEGVREAQHNTS